MNITKKLALIIFALCFFSSPIFAWDNTGHRLISAIAYGNLTPAAKQKVDTLSNLLDPGFTPRDRFLYIATLPDQWRKTDNGVSANWHFINTPWSVDGSPTDTITTPNLLTVLQKNQDVLTRSNSTPQEKAKALALVIHLIEDAHQPLHTINLFSQQFPHGDKGGNLFFINDRNANSLHAYWDQSARLLTAKHKHYPLSNKQILRLGKQLQQQYPKTAFAYSIDDRNATDWINESFALAKTTAYQVKLNDKISWQYEDIVRTNAARQMVLAGYRLAEWLNETSSISPCILCKTAYNHP